MDNLADLASTVGNRFATNLKGSFTSMTPEQIIRLVIIAGAYLLLRPYLVKLGMRAQMQSHEKEEAAEKEKQAQISANELRGKVDIPDDTDDEDDESGKAGASGPDWGKKARRRQRAVMKKLLDAEEQRLRESREEEEDKDIEEFLVKE
ncbi:protein trafficking Pga2 [Dichotomopilus funicola]|uniref:Protein trafficking Pga2 n=1 Tax=Dichotomopilus funicola TaxID=1934379 RepID=A0AAN6ZRC9_9PEZI|nr:protein trafficking Pga2 [Dichotomopilus funicola]